MNGETKEIEAPVPAVHVPETRTFGFTTRLADFDTPQIERIVRPAATLPNPTPRIRVQARETGTHAEVRGRPDAPFDRLKHEVKRVLHRRIAPMDLPDDVFGLDMRAHFLNNHAHLVHEMLAPLRFIEHALEAYPDVARRPIQVLLGSNPWPIATRFLEAAGVPFLTTDGPVRGTFVEIDGHHDVSLIPFLERQPLEGWSEPTPKRVYVSRRPHYRAVLNEDEVVDFLEAEGYQRVFMEDYPLEQQWALLVEAEEIVGIHGAGLAGLAFAAARPETWETRPRVVELYSPGYSNSCFRDYAAGVGAPWVGVRGRITADIVRDLDERGDIRAHHGAHFDVDLGSLRMALEYARSGGGRA